MIARRNLPGDSVHRRDFPEKSAVVAISRMGFWALIRVTEGQESLSTQEQSMIHNLQFRVALLMGSLAMSAVLAAAPETERKQVVPVLERLEQPVALKSPQTPLKSVFEEIGQQTQTRFVMDAEALKFAGYTQHMVMPLPRTGDSGKELIQRIVNQFQRLYVVIDDEQDLVTVTTEKGAEKLTRQDAVIRAIPKKPQPDQTPQ
jgi:hypothetical protein